MEKPELMERILDTYNIRYNATRSGWQSVQCPNEAGHAHGDRHPSARLNMTLGLIRCMGCDLNGDAYNVLMLIKGCDFKAAKDELGGVSVAVESDWIL
jgi:hypothetical protein